MTIKTRVKWILGFAAIFGTQLHATTWFFENTTLQGTFSGPATVTGSVTVSGSNWSLPVNITINGPFGIFVDPGTGLQLDEGSESYADDFVDFITTQELATTTLNTVPLLSFTFTSAGLPVVDTYSLVSGALTDVNPATVPEPGATAELFAAALLVALAWRLKLRRAVAIIDDGHEAGQEAKGPLDLNAHRNAERWGSQLRTPARLGDSSSGEGAAVLTRVWRGADRDSRDLTLARGRSRSPTTPGHCDSVGTGNYPWRVG